MDIEWNGRKKHGKSRIFGRKEAEGTT